MPFLRAAAQGLQGANLTVLDGADGLNSVVASLAAQGLALLESIRNGVKPAVIVDGKVQREAVTD